VTRNTIPAAVVIALCLMAGFACSNGKTLPVGRWEGTYETDEAVLAVRLQISPNGDIFVCAPDLVNPQSLPAGDRAALHGRIADELQAAWSQTQPRRFDFDGHAFRRPGGVAPQMEWDAGTRTMTVIVYPGMHPTIRIPMHAVTDFSDNPFGT
jgi:hypothetical protein